MNGKRVLWFGMIAVAVFVHTAVGQPYEMGTAFTYQGQLTDDGSPGDGQYDFEFKLCDDPVAACTLASTTAEDHQVDEGLFTVEIDFGTDVFNGQARWLEMGVRPGASVDPYTTLSPRQELTPSPYALRASNGVGGLDALHVDAGDNVGIGTDSPSEKLEVVGNVEATGNIHADGTITSGSSITIDGTSGSEKITAGSNLEFYGGTRRILRLEAYDRNVIGGHAQNDVDVNVVNATIAGGGFTSWENRVTGNSGTVGGGSRNTAGEYATVGGGGVNTATATRSTVSGGWGNYASADHGTVGGGWANIAEGDSATVPGGHGNTAAGDYSFAAGRRAKANHHGTFVWADSEDNDFASTSDNTFLIRASGGVGIGTNAPTEQLDVDGNIHASGTITSGSSITIDGTSGSENINSTGDLDLQAGGTSRVFIDGHYGNVGIGTTPDSDYHLDVRTSSRTYAIHAENTRPGLSNMAIYGVADADGGPQYGVYGRAELNTTSSRQAYGVYGIADANDSAGAAADAYGGNFQAYADDVAIG